MSENVPPERPGCRLNSGFEQKLELGRLVSPAPAWASGRPDIAEALKSGPGHLRFALTGGIASGKSSLAAVFERLGVKHIDFDLLARRAVEPGGQGLAQATELLGPGAIGADGRLDRAAVGKAVFADPELKKALEDIIHPLTWKLMGEELDKLATEKAAMVSVPLLFEAGLESFFKPVVMIFVPPEIQLQRLLKRDLNLTPEEAQSRLNNQWPAAAKVSGATHIITNLGSLEESACQAEALWRVFNESFQLR